MVYAKLKHMPARRDGRPQFYDIAPGDRVQCFYCLRNGLQTQYGYGVAVLADPANPPGDGADKGAVYTVCIPHLPDDAVIYHPGRNECRTKDGQNTWTEKDA